MSLKELFNYAKSGVTTNLPLWGSKSWFHGDTSQTPRFYAGGNGDLVIFRKRGS